MNVEVLDNLFQEYGYITLNDLKKINYDIFVDMEIANRGEILEDKNYEIDYE